MKTVDRVNPRNEFERELIAQHEERIKESFPDLNEEDLAAVPRGDLRYNFFWGDKPGLTEEEVAAEALKGLRQIAAGDFDLIENFDEDD